MLGIALSVVILADLSWAGYYGNYDCKDGKDVFVHLFEWKWKDVAKECEGFLSSHGFCAVQVSRYFNSLKRLSRVSTNLKATMG